MNILFYCGFSCIKISLWLSIHMNNLLFLNWSQETVFHGEFSATTTYLKKKKEKNPKRRQQ